MLYARIICGREGNAIFSAIDTTRRSGINAQWASVRSLQAREGAVMKNMFMGKTAEGHRLLAEKRAEFEVAYTADISCRPSKGRVIAICAREMQYCERRRSRSPPVAIAKHE